MSRKWVNILRRGIVGMCIALMPLAAFAEVESDLADTMRSSIPPPKLKVSSWLLMDAATGLTLAGDRADTPVEPASLTKLMTAYIVFREIERGTIKMDDTVIVSEKAWRSEGSRMFIEAGDKVQIEDLLMGLIVQSGNDSAVALAEHVAGSEEGFAEAWAHAVIVSHYKGGEVVEYSKFVSSETGRNLKEKVRAL